MELDFGTILVQVLNFLILFGLLWVLLYKPLKQTLENRAKTIKDNLEAAERARLEAQNKLKELETKLANIEREAQERINERLKYAQKVSNSIIEEAKAEAQKIRETALREINEAKRKAIEEIKELTVKLVTETFKELLDREISEAYTRKALIKAMPKITQIKR